jgi:hypothetical protein
MNLGPLIAALITVESNGRDNAVGDGGRAIGALQIHKSVVVDVNRIAGTHYTHQQMTNRVAARKVCEIYLRHYVTEKRIGRKPTVADFAKVWNSGPDGFKKTCSDRYALKVQLQTAKQNDSDIEKWKTVSSR